MSDENKTIAEPETELQREILQPISGSSPTGQDAREANDYDNLKAEIDKRGGNDYEQVIAWSRDILTQESKDLRVASYLSFGLFNPAPQYKAALDGAKKTLTAINDELRRLGELTTPTVAQRKKLEELPPQAQAAQQQVNKMLAEYKTKYRFDGLAEGLQIIHALLLKFGDNLFPKGDVARSNAIYWLVNKLGAIPEICTITAEHRPGLIKAKEALTPLNEWVSEKFPDKRPWFKNVLGEIEKQIRLLPAPKPPAPPKPKPEQPGVGDQASPTSDTTTTSEPPKDDDAGKGTSIAATFKNIADAKEIISKASAFIYEKDEKDPLSFRIRRMQIWTEKPDADQSHKTLIPPPQNYADFRSEIQEKLKNKEWVYVIARCEEKFRQEDYFWLDLQRYIELAASSGEGFKAVAEAIRLEMAGLLARMPGIEKLRFSDEKTPFADAETQKWLAQLAKPGAGGEASANGQLNNAAAADLTAEFEAAQKILAKDGLNNALNHLQTRMRADASYQNRFRRRLFMATLCVEKEQIRVALPLLEALDKEIDKHSLQLWDPELSLQVWLDLRKCYNQMAQFPEFRDNPNYREGAKRILEKICQIDASRAIEG
jgi:type VI secretion system protein VasJ